MYHNTLHNDSVKFLVGTNSDFIGKAGERHKNKLANVGFWQWGYFEKIAELCDHIGKGHAWMPSPVDKGQWKNARNCNHLEIPGFDVDHDLQIDKAMEIPFIRDYANAIIESASSTPQENRYRIIFRLATPIKGSRNIARFLQFMVDKYLAPYVDKQCKNADRIFYGAPGKKPVFVHEDRRIPESILDECEAWHKEQDAIAAERQAKAEAFSKLLRESISITDLRSIAVQALTYTSRRVIGNNTYDEVFRCLAALVWEFGEADAVAMMESHSPSYRDKKGEWNVDRTARSISRGSSSGKQCRIGTLFDYAVKGGWVFPPELKELQKEYAIAHGGGALVWQKTKPGDYKKKAIQRAVDKSTDKLNPEERAIAKKIISVVPGSTPVNPLEVQAHESQFKLWKEFTTKFTHDYEICSKYLKLDLFKDQINEKTWGLFVRSGLGTGKTFMLKPGKGAEGLIDYVNKLLNLSPDERVAGGIVLTHRNSLSSQIGERLGDSKQISEASEKEKREDFTLWLLGCVNSIIKIPPERFKGRILVIDELVSVLEHTIVGSTCHEDRKEIFARLTQSIKDAAFVVCLDANMTDWASDFIIKLREPGEDVNCLKLNNKTIQKDVPVEIIASFNQNEITNQVVELLPLYKSRNEAIVLAADSQSYLEKMDKILTKAGFKGIRADSTTTHRKEIQEFIKAPDEACENIDIVLYSPVCDTGMSMGSPRIAHTFVAFCGILGTTAQTQQTRRPREAKRITISCVPYTRLNMSFASRKAEYIEDVQDTAFENIDKCCKGVPGISPEQIQAMKDNWLNTSEAHHRQLFYDIKHFRNYERKNTLECLVTLFKYHGYEPTVIEEGEIVGKMKAELDEYYQQEAIAILESRKIDDNEAEILENTTPLTIQERRELRSWTIRSQYPDWEENWNQEWIHEKSTQLIASFDSKEKLKEAGKIIQIQEATGIFKAPDITAGQARDLKIKTALTPEERWKLARYRIKQDLPGICTKLDGKYWNIDGIVEIRKRLFTLSDVRIRWSFYNMEKARFLRQLKWVSDLEEDRWFGDQLQNYYGKAKMLHDMKINELLEAEEFSGEHSLVKEIAGMCANRKPRLRGTLGIVKGQMENIPLMKKFLGVMGIRLECSGRLHGAARTYQVSPFDELDKLIYDCTAQLLETQYSNEFEAYHKPQNIEYNRAEMEQTFTQDTTAQNASILEPLESVAESVDVEQIRKYDRFLYRGYEAIYINSFAGDLNFYIPSLQRKIALLPANVAELTKIKGSTHPQLQDWLEMNVA